MVKLWTDEKIAEMEALVKEMIEEADKTTERMIGNLEEIVKNLEGSQDNISKLQKMLEEK